MRLDAHLPLHTGASIAAGRVWRSPSGIGPQARCTRKVLLRGGGCRAPYWPAAFMGRRDLGARKGRVETRSRNCAQATCGDRRSAMRSCSSSCSVKAWLIVPVFRACYVWLMRVIARSTLVGFWSAHPETKVALERWRKRVKAACWTSTDEVQRTVPKRKAINRDRVRFEVEGGSYRLAVAFDFCRQAASLNSLAHMLSMIASTH